MVSWTLRYHWWLSRIQCSIFWQIIKNRSLNDELVIQFDGHLLNGCSIKELGYEKTVWFLYSFDENRFSNKDDDYAFSNNQ